MTIRQTLWTSPERVEAYRFLEDEFERAPEGVVRTHRKLKGGGTEEVFYCEMGPPGSGGPRLRDGDWIVNYMCAPQKEGMFVRQTYSDEQMRREFHHDDEERAHMALMAKLRHVFRTAPDSLPSNLAELFEKFETAREAGLEPPEDEDDAEGED